MTFWWLHDRFLRISSTDETNCLFIYRFRNISFNLQLSFEVAMIFVLFPEVFSSPKKRQLLYFVGVQQNNHGCPIPHLNTLILPGKKNEFSLLLREYVSLCWVFFLSKSVYWLKWMLIHDHWLLACTCNMRRERARDGERDSEHASRRDAETQSPRKCKVLSNLQLRQRHTRIRNFCSPARVCATNICWTFFLPSLKTSHSTH